jgi:hypothetical protein
MVMMQSLKVLKHTQPVAACMSRDVLVVHHIATVASLKDMQRVGTARSWAWQLVTLGTASSRARGWTLITQTFVGGLGS